MSPIATLRHSPMYFILRQHDIRGNTGRARRRLETTSFWAEFAKMYKM